MRAGERGSLGTGVALQLWWKRGPEVCLGTLGNVEKLSLEQAVGIQVPWRKHSGYKF